MRPLACSAISARAPSARRRPLARRRRPGCRAARPQPAGGWRGRSSGPRRRARDQRPDVAHAPGIQAVRGLVEDEELRLPEERRAIARRCFMPCEYVLTLSLARSAESHRLEYPLQRRGLVRRADPPPPEASGCRGPRGTRRSRAPPRSLPSSPAPRELWRDGRIS